MTKTVTQTNSFVGFEYLPAEPVSNSITIYHPFASLANEHFSNKGFSVTKLECGSTNISFENLTKEETKELAEEVKRFLKNSRQQVIKEFLIYKNGVNL